MAFPTYKLYGPGSEIATKFAGTGHPKLKFLFTAKFIFRSNSPSVVGAEDLHAMDFDLRQASRPAPNIIYQDANFYNFRTKIATKVDFGQATIVMYDDITNKAHDIYKTYLETVSPIANQQVAAAGTLEDGGLGASSSVAPLENKYGILSSITTTHHYQSYAGNGSVIPKKTHYRYLNPKFVNMTLDELDMGLSEPNTITMNFIYDSVNIENESGGGGGSGGSESSGGFSEEDQARAAGTIPGFI